MQGLLDFDARKLTEAIKYQIHIAIDYCHTLDDDESLWIEVFGDVTAGTRDQIEVKLYSEDLTDGHHNFWNTLNNWLKPEFNHSRFKNLVLLTNQSFGSRSQLREWNRLDSQARLQLLLDIHASILGSGAGKKPKKNSEKKSVDQIPAHKSEGNPSKPAKQRTLVLSEERRPALVGAIPKIQIVTEHDDLMGLLAKYGKDRLSGINPTKTIDYQNDLFGFITDADRIGKGWEIKGHEFRAKCRELTERYIVGTVEFPSIDKAAISRIAAETNTSLRTYARKLDEIGASNLLPRATFELLQAHQYITQMIEDCSTTRNDVEKYQDKHHESHSYNRMAASLEFDIEATKYTVKRASLRFYAARCGEAVVPFSKFKDTPQEFRNGIYHLLADESPGTRTEEFHWRLWDE